VSEFEGKIVLVTGCARARGMGRAIAAAFQENTSGPVPRVGGVPQFAGSS